MSEVHELQVTIREDLGKSHSRRMRRLDNHIPAVIYGAGEDPQHITLDHNKVIKATENEAFYSSIVTLDVAGKKQKAVLKAIQRHAFKPKILHMDFLRISAKEKITMTVPLHFLGEDIAPGVKTQGGIIYHLETSAEVSCLPGDLPEYITVDVSKLALEETIHLSHLKLPKGVELVDLAHENDKAVASIHLPRAAAAETTEEEAPAEAAEVPASKQSEEKPSE